MDLRQEPLAAALAGSARVAGLRGESLPSLEQVERRRFELWLLTTGLIVSLTVGLALLSLWDGAAVHTLLQRPAVRYGATALALVICAYLIEKELSLRRISALLFDERLLTVALSNRLREISTLLDAGRAVNSALELEQVLAAILRGTVELLPAASGSVMLLDGEALVVAAVSGQGPQVGMRLPVGDGIAGHVARTRAPLLVDGKADASLFPGYRPRAHQTHSALCVPLVERDELLGVLNVASVADASFSEYDLRAVALFAEHAAAAIAKARLFAAHQAQTAELAHRAHHDPLTGLANRRALDDWSTRAFAAGRAFGLLFIDLDGFKLVNDSYGHEAGDQLLVAAAGRLARCISERDLAARLGGDEFALAVVGVTPEALAGVVRRVLATLAAPFGLGRDRVHLSASVGLARSRPQGPEAPDLAALLRQADAALYAAKAAGKNCAYELTGEAGEPRLVCARERRVPRPRVPALPMVGGQA